MNRIAPLGAAILVLLSSLGIGGVQGTRAPAPPSAHSLISRLRAHGVHCTALRDFAPRLLEREEVRCREFGLATFRTTRRRARWTLARSRESWLSARFLVTGPSWVGWTWSPEVAQDVRHAIGGTVLPLRLPPARPKVEKACDSRPAARPTPISPSGPVYSYKREFWDTDITDTCTGLLVVAETAAGSTALTGVAESWKDGGPLSGVPVVLRSVHVDGVEDAPRAPTVIKTVTDREGGYAFVDVPVAASGSCYALTIDAGTYGMLEYQGFFEPGEEYQQTVDMEFAEVGDGDAGCFPSTGGRQRPRNTGSRFSTNAARPSLASSLANSSPNVSPSASRFDA